MKSNGATTSIQKYHICHCFIDGSSVFMIRQICRDFGLVDVTLYDDKTRDVLLRTTGCGGEQLIHAVNFRTKHRLMLELLHRLVRTHQLRVDPVKFPKVATALRTATNKPNGSLYELDKSLSASNDVLDALRLCCLCLPSKSTMCRLLSVLISRRLCYRLHAEIICYWSLRWPAIDCRYFWSNCIIGVLAEEWSLNMISSGRIKVRSISYCFITSSH